MANNGWMTATIILAMALIAETALFFWVYSTGTQMLDNENECAYNVCARYDAYAYDNIEKICYCYESYDEDEVVYTRYMR